MSSLRPSHRLVIVTGKGGVGKSLLAAALADRSAARGLRTVLVTLDTRDERHPLLEVPLRYRPEPSSRGFAVSRVDAFQAAAEYARRNLPFGALYEGFFKSRAFHDFAAAAPGFEELMCLGKLFDLATGSDFDRVIFDAPASGHLKELLAVPRVTQEAVRVGPLNHNARRIEDLLLDADRTHVLVATLAEEMPVREALEVVALCRDGMRMSVGPLLVNRRVRRRFSDREMVHLEDLAASRGLSEVAHAAVAVARDEHAMAASQREALESLGKLASDVVTIPRIVHRTFDLDILLDRAGESVERVFATAGSVSPAARGSPAAAASPAPSASAPAQARPRASNDGVAPGASTAAPRLDVQSVVASHRILVCCGSGGVGKTTSAAALGVVAARAGLKVQVMTIDPARRLAQAMGLDALSDEPQRVALDAPGELWAMMLDSKHAFDHLVETYAPDARVKEAIFANHYYQQLSSSLGGSRELMAMERVYETALEGNYDLLIVDTPPSQHALDFLDAPERLVNLLDGSLTGLLVRPYGLAARAQFNLFRQSSAAALKFMERFTGVQMLADLSEFLLAFSSMFEGFRDRSHKVQALMREATTAFLLVCTPEPASLRQVDQFAQRLRTDGLQIAGVLANRVHAPPPSAGRRGGAELDLEHEELARLAEAGDPAFSDLPLPERLAAAWEDAVDLHLADQAALQRVQNGRLSLHAVREFSADLHSLADLERFAALLGPSTEPQP